VEFTLRRLEVPEAAAPAQQATQHIMPTTMAIGTAMKSTTPATVTPIASPTTVWEIINQ
jgi:hypothetical protein